MNDTNCLTLEELRLQLEAPTTEVEEHLRSCLRCRALMRLLAEEQAPLPRPPEAPDESEPAGEDAAAAKPVATDLGEASVIIASSPHAPGELLVAVVLDTESEATGGEGLVVAPLSPETQFVSDGDLIVDGSQTLLGWDALVEIWNHGVLLREQIEELRGSVRTDAWHRMALLYSAAVGEIEQDAEAGWRPAPIGDGLPIEDDRDPRLVFQDEEVERTQRFYRPAARLLAAGASHSASAEAEVSKEAGATTPSLTVGALLAAWLDEQAYEAADFAREIGFARREVEMVLANELDPLRMSEDRLAELLVRPHENIDRDDLEAGLTRSLEDADWALVGTYGTEAAYGRTAGIKESEREMVLRARRSGTPLGHEEQARLKKAYVQNVLAALEEKTGR